ncbi:MAG: group I intron-associated PD-(D/E)XK endonuclease [Actinomycetota bacterium]|nr:group I intron-associated PD-(D/E)XK endonuclease [Actinomycetota bacterium]
MKTSEASTRVQCKSARLVGGVVSFRTSSNTRNAPKDYVGEVDYFGVYSPDLDKVFLVPIGDVPSRYCFLRLDSAKNSQTRRVRWARDYLL